MFLTLVLSGLFIAVALAVVFSLSRPEPISKDRFVEPDQLFQTLEANIRDCPEFELIADIDHARLGAKAGTPMPPSHVLIWSDPVSSSLIWLIRSDPV